MAEREAGIQASLSAGTSTRERADVMLQNMEQNIVRAVNRTTIGQPAWAGAGGNVKGTCSGLQIGNQRDINGTGYGESGPGTEPGNMNKWGESLPVISH